MGDLFVSMCRVNFFRSLGWNHLPGSHCKCTGTTSVLDPLFLDAHLVLVLLLPSYWSAHPCAISTYLCNISECHSRDPQHSWLLYCSDFSVLSKPWIRFFGLFVMSWRAPFELTLLCLVSIFQFQHVLIPSELDSESCSFSDHCIDLVTRIGVERECLTKIPLHFSTTQKL